MARLHELGNDELAASLKDCCGAESWVSALLRHAPFRDDGELLAAADRAFDELSVEEWKETFETTQVHTPDKGDAATRGALRTALRLYQERFGHPFVAVTSSDAADELLMRVRIRLGNEPDHEWRVSREEQRRLVRLRVQRLLAAPGRA
jgi:2-oxo-4-hydroxy-4-carboxy-5-ureidoimidazoline decarboxylase